MAGAENPLQDLCEETTCPICLDYFREPVMIPECGHNFCQGCLSQNQGKGGTVSSCCPQCRHAFQHRSLLPNRQLANMVEIAKKLSLQGPTVAKERKEAACEKHQEPLKLFCKNDETLICVVCDRSKEHRNHEVVPVEEAAEAYEDLVLTQLELLRKKRQKILIDKTDAEMESQQLLELIQTERQKTVSHFQEIRQFLEEQEKLLLVLMDEAEKETARQRDDHIAMLSRELTSVECLIQKLEEKRKQPASELLKDVRSTLQRSEEKTLVFENPVAFSPELKWRIWDVCDINPSLNAVMEQFKKDLLHEQQLEKANVRLDPDTAHPRLILSKDFKSVRWGDKNQDLPNNPERFDVRTFVLGHEEFATGRHFWEVLVEGEGIWALGVVRKSVKRKGPVEYSPEEGIWAMGKWNGNYRSIKPPGNPLLPLRREPTRIRVTLNCTGERVAFFDADTGDFLCEFSQISFGGETLHPYFYVIKKGHLRILS